MMLCINHNYQGEYFKRSFLLKDLQLDDHDEEFSAEEEYDSDCEEVERFSLPISETMCEYFQNLLQEKFIIDDLAFMFDMSRKRNLSPYAILLSMIYLKRLKESSSKWRNVYSSSELCLVSLLLASKYLIDEGEANDIYNEDWAETAKVSVKKVNQIEKNILSDLDWNLFVSAQEYLHFLEKFNLRFTIKKVKFQQNSCTYADVDYLFQNCYFLDALRQNIEFLSKIVVIFSLSISYFCYSSVVGALMTNNVHTQLRVFATHDNVVLESSNTSEQLFNSNNRFNFDSDVSIIQLEQKQMNESFHNLSMILKPVISPTQYNSGAKNMNKIEFNGINHGIGRHVVDVTKQNEWALKENSFAINLKADKR